MQYRVAVLGIIIEDKSSVDDLNHILSAFSKYIIGRMGIPYPKRDISIISISVDAPQDVISALSGKIGRLKGVQVKAAYSNSVFEEEFE